MLRHSLVSLLAGDSVCKRFNVHLKAGRLNKRPISTTESWRNVGPGINIIVTFASIHYVNVNVFSATSTKSNGAMKPSIINSLKLRKFEKSY